MGMMHRLNNVLLLGVDGGGTRCRARLARLDGAIVGEGSAGPANIRLGVKKSFSAVQEAARQCLQQAGVANGYDKIIACLALAGASEPFDLLDAQAYPHPFRRAMITTDARAACVGAHGGRDGGVVIIGTGSVAWGMACGHEYRVGGWGFPVSDEGSGAWLGCEALRRVLWANDGLLPWSDMLRAAFDRFDRDPHAIVRWMDAAGPRDLGSLAPAVVDFATRGDAVAGALMRKAAGHVDAMAGRLVAFGMTRLALMGGLAHSIEPYVSSTTRKHLVQPEGDALSGALHLAQAEAEALVTRQG
jgi:glucosamine kinase